MPEGGAALVACEAMVEMYSPSVCVCAPPQGSINNADLLQKVFADEQIDTIMHFAAQTHVGAWACAHCRRQNSILTLFFRPRVHLSYPTDNSFGNSFKFSETNLMGTHVMLESAKTYGGIKRFIHVSSDEVYGESEVRCVAQ